MKNLILYLFIFTVIFITSKAFAQTASNSDFNPFPQMEQDQKNVDDETVAKPDGQNDDVWPPVNSDAQGNNER